jgi:hypothetical protein
LACRSCLKAMSGYGLFLLSLVVLLMSFVFVLCLLMSCVLPCVCVSLSNRCISSLTFSTPTVAVNPSPPTRCYLSCVLPCLALPCIVLSCLVLPCLVLSCLVLSCLVLSCLVLSCLVLSCLVLSCLVLSCLVLSCLVLSCLVLPCLVLSCLVLSCLVLPCLVVSYRCQACWNSGERRETIHVHVERSCHFCHFVGSVHVWRQCRTFRRDTDLRQLPGIFDRFQLHCVRLRHVPVPQSVVPRSRQGLVLA